MNRIIRDFVDPSLPASLTYTLSFLFLSEINNIKTKILRIVKMGGGLFTSLRLLKNPGPDL